MSPIVVFEPSGLRLQVDEETTILQALRMAGLRVDAECGGKGTCGKCQVILNPSLAPSEKDQKHLKKGQLDNGIRLACQHRTETDLRVVLLEPDGPAKILAEGIGVSLEWDIDPGQEEELGIAVDVGTTTIVAYLMDLHTGVQIAHSAILNPQVAYGEDVMTRLEYSLKGARERKELQTVLVSGINGAVKEFSEIRHEKHITKVSVVGNTVMQTLLLAADGASLARAPYKPSISGSVNTDGERLGLDIKPSPSVYVAPSIAKYVGSDTLGFIISQGLEKTRNTILGVDIGTNGEIVLARKGELYCCSTAAGSAFEGATITHGMRAQTGAIDYVRIDNNRNLIISTIGGEQPLGICGSGIVDLIAEMRGADIIDASGRMNPAFDKVRKEQNGELALILCSRGRAEARQDIVFTQSDVRQVQLAKAAIRSGITILLKETDTLIQDVDSLLLAGAFGTYIRPLNAMKIGLLPTMNLEGISTVGNAAGEGAKRLLLSEDVRNDAELTARRTKYIDLATNAEFQEILLSHIPIPECTG